MKLLIFVLFALVCMLAVSDAQKKKCDRPCNQPAKPICATRDGGKTYKRFNNNCLLEVANCKTNNAWKRADIKKCKK